MLLSNDKEHRVRAGLQEAISLFCKAGLKYDVEMTIEGLLAVTLDQKEVFLVNIKEIIRQSDTDVLNSTSCGTESNVVQSSAMSESSDYSGSQSESASDILVSEDLQHAHDGSVASDCMPTIDTSAVDQLSLRNKVRQKSRRKQMIVRKTINDSTVVSPSSSEMDYSESMCGIGTEPHCTDSNKDDVAEDLSVKNVDQLATKLVSDTDICKIEPTNDLNSSPDQLAGGLLVNISNEKFLQHIKQEPLSLLCNSDEASTSSTASVQFLPSLTSIQQQFGLMSQYISMPQAVSGLHPSFLAPYSSWTDQVLSRITPPLSFPQANQVVATSSTESDAERLATTVKRTKMSLNIPSVRSNGRIGSFKSSPFLSPERNICANCGAGRTTVWRRTEDKQVLCNACGCYFKLHKVHRPLSMVRQEIRSRCRRPKNLSSYSSSKKHIRDVILPPAVAEPDHVEISQDDMMPSDTALNLKVSPPIPADINDQS